MTALWRTIVPSHEPAHMVKGTEIEVIVPDGFRSRFAVYSVRCYVPDTTRPIRHASMFYRVRDAERINDADLRAGKRPPIIGQFATFHDAMASIAHYKIEDDEQ